MQNIRTLSVTFNEPIEIRELECFRGAIVEKVGLEREWYHNHNNATDRQSDYHYRYPLVQYSLRRRRPRILFINKAIDEARYFFSQPDWNLRLAGRVYPTHIDQLKAKQVQIGWQEEMKEYRIERWLALNEQNYDAYHQMNALRDKISLLERVLAGNIISMAKGLDYRFPERFELELSDWQRCRALPYKGISLLTFDLSFRTNLVLPLGFGVGKGSSMGWGRLGELSDTRLCKKTENKTQNYHA